MASLSSSSSLLTSFIPKHDVNLQVPLAIGTLQWGTTWIDQTLINSKGGVVPEQTCRDILRVIASHGVTLLDTAEGYGGGTSEKRCGRLVRYHQQHQQKTKTITSSTNSNSQQLILMTKFLPAPWRLFHSDFVRAVRGSCQRLGVKSIDVYLLHSPVHWLRPLEYWIEAGAVCYNMGLIRSMGLSNCNADQVRRAVATGNKLGVPVVCNQVHYSLLDYNSKELQDMQVVCNELNVKIIAFSPIGQGLLTDGMSQDKFERNKPAKMLRLQNLEDLHALRATLSEMAQKYDKTMAQVALNWCIQHHVIPLVGCRSPSQALDSCGCLGWSLSKEDVAKLDAVALDKSTLESPAWRRMLFVSLFAMVMVVCRTLDSLGYGSVVPLD